MNHIKVTRDQEEVNLQTELDDIAAKARSKIEDWQKGDKAEQSGKAIKKIAVIEYGKLLLDGRSKHSSNKAFGDWVIAGKLDASPFDNNRVRSDAIRIAELVFQNSLEDSFSACPNTNPSDMVTWARATGLIEPKLKAAPQSQISINRQFAKQFKREEDIAKGLPVPPLPLDKETEKAINQQVHNRVNEMANLPKGEKRSLEKTLVAETKKITQESIAYKERVDVESRKFVEAEVKRRLEKQFPDYQKRLADAYEREQHYHKLIEAVKKPLTESEYIDVVICCHEDNSASKEKRKTTTQMLNAKKFNLTGRK